VPIIPLFLPPIAGIAVPGRNLMDAILTATGGPTIQEGLAGWFGKQSNETVQDAELRWLNEPPQSIPRGHVQDMWLRYLGRGFRLNIVDYDNVSKDIGAENMAPRDVTFNPDGTKMYMVGTETGKTTVDQYSLNPGFNLLTAGDSDFTLDIDAQTTGPTCFSFSLDGKKLFILSKVSPFEVIQYNLNPGFILSTASYSNIRKTVNQDFFPRGLTFNNDGTSMYMLGFVNKAIYQYSLSPGFDLDSLTYSGVNKLISAQTIEPASLVFNSDGTKLFLLGFSLEQAVYQYSLNPGFDLSTLNYDNISTLIVEDTIPVGIDLSANGSKMYIVGVDTTNIYQYSLNFPGTLNDRLLSYWVSKVP